MVGKLDGGTPEEPPPLGGILYCMVGSGCMSGGGCKVEGKGTNV